MARTKAEQVAEPHKCTLETLRAQHSITEEEYLFLKGGSNTPEIFQRVEAISRIHGTAGVGGVFYALEDGQISVGKAMQVVRRFLLTGEVEDYTRAEAEAAESR
jgi:hypothetical protein